MKNLDELNAIAHTEGLHDALNEVCEVLTGVGVDKYPPRHWYDNVTYEEHLDKAEGHLICPGRESESGKLHLAHTIARLLFCMTMELDEGE